MHNLLQSWSDFWHYYNMLYGMYLQFSERYFHTRNLCNSMIVPVVHTFLIHVQVSNSTYGSYRESCATLPCAHLLENKLFYNISDTTWHSNKEYTIQYNIYNTTVVSLYIGCCPYGLHIPNVQWPPEICAVALYQYFWYHCCTTMLFLYPYNPHIPTL